MPRHPDFQVLYDKFVNEYGKEEGERVYYAYIHNEGFKEEHAMPGRHKDDKNTKVDTKSNNSNIEKAVAGISDAIEGNYTKVSKSVEAYLTSEKKKVALIIEKFIDDYYVQGLNEAARELSMIPSEFGDLRIQTQQRKILTDNAKELAFNLYDDINKEITLLITNINLNNVPFTNQELKAEVQRIFEKKQERLSSQVVSEGNRSFNTALEFGYKKSGVVTHKQWVSVIDDKTSTTCLTLNGEIVELGQPFSLGMYTAPAHPNCRARIKPITISSQN